MAKNRNNRYSSEASAIPMRSLGRVGLPRLSSLPDLSVFEDRRQYHPDRIPVAYAFPRSSARLVYRNKNKQTGYNKSTAPGSDPAFSSLVGFEVPSRVAICVRRKRRQEVLFALNKTRAGKGRSKKRGPYSGVVC